jgi:hypothetical protein
MLNAMLIIKMREGGMREGVVTWTAKPDDRGAEEFSQLPVGQNQSWRGSQTFRALKVVWCGCVPWLSQRS